MTQFIKDTELRFPHVMLVSASAGAGKTYLLSLRFVQFLLSDVIEKSHIENIFATTFTNNAAFEMKKRVLLWLKKIALSKLSESDKENIKYTFSSYNNLEQKAKKVIWEILDNYHSFNVSTIDAFMTRIAKASAMELGLSPDFDIFMEKDAIIDESVRIFISSLTEDQIGQLIKEMQKIDSDKIDFYLVDTLKKEAKRFLYAMEQSNKDIISSDDIKRIEEEKDALFDELRNLYMTYTGFNIDELEKDVRDFNTKGKFGANDIRKNSSKEIDREIIKKRGMLIEKLKILKSHLLSEFSYKINNLIDKRIHAQGKIHIGEITAKLHSFLKEGMIPGIYFSLGERFYHFMIDEFQDTNPIQWDILKLLVDEALSKGGSLFIVGDIKQAIYGFRGSDYRVMKELIDELDNNRDPVSFPQIPKEQFYFKNLEENHRSDEHIIEYVDNVFKEKLIDIATEYDDPTRLTKYVQHPIKGHIGKGYVKTTLIFQEELKEEILSIIEDARSRGFSYNDIGIITERNDTVLEISGYLTEEHIPVISESGTDIRRRKIIKEILYLLKFLDSPIDDFSFAMFIAGDIAKAVGIKDIIELLVAFKEEGMDVPLYVYFKAKRPDEWKRFFDPLFTQVGYLSTYDLLLSIINIFKVFEHFEDETEAILKLLDIALEKEEQEGSIKHLIELLEREGEMDIFQMDTTFLKNGVHLMTIHKAKGLEFDVVINVITKKIGPQQGKHNDLISYNTPYGTVFMKISKDERQNSTPLERAYEDYWGRKTVEGLNMQYVAMTRPIHELYNLVLLKGNKKVEPVLEIDEDEIGNKIEKKASNIESPEIMRIEDLAYTTQRGYQYIAWTQSRVNDTKRGDFYHMVMSEIHTKSDLEHLDKIIEKYMTISGFFEDGIKEKIEYIVKQSPLAPYFTEKEGRVIKNEVSFIDKNGHILRMDRVVIDKSDVFVIDYKTGKMQEDLYKAQIEQYMHVLKGIYNDKEIKGILFDIDTGEYDEYSI